MSSVFVKQCSVGRPLYLYVYNCQEDVYQKELIRYIHLNPLRTNIVKDLAALDAYPYAVHSAIMEKCSREWQSVNSVLSLFDARISTARRAYGKYIEAGIDQGRRPELMRGGLVHSAGGWADVKSLGKEGIFLKSDERILGDGDFVKTVLAKADEAMERKYALAAQGVDVDRLIQLTAELLSIHPKRIFGPAKSRDVVKARNLICHWGTSEFKLTMTYLASALGIAVPTASVAAKRGERMASEKGYSLIELLNIKGVPLDMEL